MPFAKGTSGNPAGTPANLRQYARQRSDSGERPPNDGAYAQMRDLFKEILRESPMLVKTAVRESLQDPKARVAMLAILRDSVDGRPASDATMNGPRVQVIIGAERPAVTIVTPAPTALSPAPATRSALAPAPDPADRS
jgi:hypothetical protein